MLYSPIMLMRGLGLIAMLGATLQTAYPMQDIAAGGKLYAAHCAACHGQNGEGGRGARLTTLTRAPGVFANYTTWIFVIDGPKIDRLSFELRGAN